MNDLRKAAVDRKVVAVRVDLNVPTDDCGRITDDTRIAAALPTTNHLRRSGAKVLLLSHFGRPKGRPDPSMSLEPVARALEGYLDEPRRVRPRLHRTCRRGDGRKYRLRRGCAA